MQKITFDTGIKEFEINDKHILRFNPSDPNVYARFFESFSDVEALEAEYEKKMSELGADGMETDDKGFAVGFGKAKTVTETMKEFDLRIKQKLSYAFGESYDFDEILEHINVLAFGANGERIITNVLNAFTPIFEEGMREYTEKEAQEAVETAKLNREQRRALAKMS